MRALLVLLLLVSPAMTGCLLEGAGPGKVYREREFGHVTPSGVLPVQRTDSDAYVILVRGEEAFEVIEEREKDSRTICPESPAFHIDQEKRRLRYESDYFQLDPKPAIVVAVEYEGVVVSSSGLRSGCASVQQVLSFPGRAVFNVSLRHDYTLQVVVEAPDGFLSVNRNYFAPMGQQVEGGIGRIEHSEKTDYWVYGSYTVTNLGAWPRANITKY